MDRRQLRNGRRQRGQAALEAIGVGLAIAVLVGTAVAHAARRAAGDDRVATAVRAAAAAPAPATSLAEAVRELPAGLAVVGAGPVAVAEQLLALGVREEPPGSDSGPLVLAITDGNAEPWCADFVSYAYWKSGHPVTGGLSGGWRIAGALALRRWFIDRGRWTLRAQAQPQPGDTVYFTWDHVGLVRRVVGADLETIEGNASHRVRLKTYRNWRQDAGIDGFGRR